MGKTMFYNHGNILFIYSNSYYKLDYRRFINYRCFYNNKI